MLRLAKPRLGDAGPQAILEFVGNHDRQRKKVQKPTFEPEVEEETTVEDTAAEDAAIEDDASTADGTEPQSVAEEDSEKEEQ